MDKKFLINEDLSHIDMAETGDCTALVAVMCDPVIGTKLSALRVVKIFTSKRLGGIIDQEKDVAALCKVFEELKEWRSG